MLARRVLGVSSDAIEVRRREWLAERRPGYEAFRCRPPAGRWACVLVLPALVAAASGIASSVARGAPEQAGFGWVWPLPVIGVLLGTARLIPALRAAPPPE